MTLTSHPHAPPLSQATRFVQVRLPNRPCGEIWETLSGSLPPFMNHDRYEQILEENKGPTSTSTEFIENDPPNCSAYQSEEGVDATRKVLQAFSSINPETPFEISRPSRGLIKNGPGSSMTPFQGSVCRATTTSEVVVDHEGRYRGASRNAD